MTDHKNIGAAMQGIYEEIGYVQKGGRMTQGGNYSYAGEADFIQAIRPAMIKHGVIIHPTKDERPIISETYITSNGKTMNRIIYPQTFRFTHTISGDHFDVAVLGEASDVGDKASNKAMTAGLKYALRQTFLIETGDDPDKHSSQEQERAEVGSARPYDAPKLKATIVKIMAAEKQKQTKATDIMRKVAAAQMNTLFGGDDNRHLALVYLVGEQSTKTMGSEKIAALLRWMKVENFEDIPDEVVIAEANEVVMEVQK